MKTIYRQPGKIWLFPLVASLVVMCCLLPSSLWAAETDVSKEVKEAGSAIAEYSAEQKDAAMENAREMMADLDERIDTMEKKLYENWADLKAASREEYRQALKSLRSQRNELSEWYGSMKHSSKETWNEVKQGFSNTYKNLRESWQQTEKEMDKQI